MRLNEDRRGLHKTVAFTLLVLIAVLAVFYAVFSSVNDRAPREPALHFFLSPHPDDELQAWSSLTQDESIYPVFVLMTRGEASDRCNPDYQMSKQSLELGAVPPPVKVVDRGETCGDARVTLWNQMLDEAGKMDRSSRLGQNVTEYSETIAGHNAQIWIGSNSARVSLDLGDGKLQKTDVIKAVHELLDLRGPILPDLPLGIISTAAYFNDPEANPEIYSKQALAYPHPDHLAVTEAGTELAPLATEGSWIVTHPLDPRATHRKEINPKFYDYMMGLGEPGTTAADDKLWEGWKKPTKGLRITARTTHLKKLPDYPYVNVGSNGRFTDPSKSELGSLPKLGVYQREFGWLAFPDPWVPGEYQLAGSDCLFAQKNFYIHVPGADK